MQEFYSKEVGVIKMNQVRFNILLLLPLSMFCVHFSSIASEAIPKQRATSIAIDEQTNNPEVAPFTGVEVQRSL